MWLGHLADQMKYTLQELLMECLKDGKKEGGSGINPNNYPSQVGYIQWLVLNATTTYRNYISYTLFFLPIDSLSSWADPIHRTLWTSHCNSHPQRTTYWTWVPTGSLHKHWTTFIIQRWRHWLTRARTKAQIFNTGYNSLHWCSTCPYWWYHHCKLCRWLAVAETVAVLCEARQVYNKNGGCWVQLYLWVSG